MFSISRFARCPSDFSSGKRSPGRIHSTYTVLRPGFVAYFSRKLGNTKGTKDSSLVSRSSISMENIKAIVFDVGGVLRDSEDAIYFSFKEAFKRYDINDVELDKETLYHLRVSTYCIADREIDSVHTISLIL